MTKYIITFLVGLVIGAGAVAVYVKYTTPTVSFGSPLGSTFNTSKLATVDMAPATSAASSTSVLNTDASTRYVKSAEIGCSSLATAGTSVATLTVTAATTSVANEGLQGNTNNVYVATVATSSTTFVMSSSTTQLASGFLNAVWPAGTYLTFLFNSTEAGTCVVGVTYLAS